MTKDRTNFRGVRYNDRLMTGMLWYGVIKSGRSYPIGRKMTRRCVDVTYASRPRITDPLS